MGGLEWSGLPVVTEMLGVQDVETFIVELTAIRAWNEASTKG